MRRLPPCGYHGADAGGTPKEAQLKRASNRGAGESVHRRAMPLLLGAAALAGIIAAAAAALGLADGLSTTGLPDPGPATSYGLPFVRGAGEIAAAVAIGNFLMAAFFVPPQSNGVLDADGYRAVRLGAVACAIWSICAALLVALTISDVSGVRLQDLSPVDVWSAAGLVETTSAWRATAVMAAFVAVATVPVLRWSWTPVLLAGALLTLVPLAVTGHSSSGGAHDIATNSLLIHLVAAALWAGGLLALLAHVLRRGGHTYLAARRFSAVALWCFAAAAISGVVNAAVRIAPSDILDSTYGRLLVVKALALCGLGVFGWRQRRSALASLQADPLTRAPFLRLALVEAAIFAATFGVAVGLGRTPSPAALTEPTPAEAVIGFDLAEPPTASDVLFGWRFDLIFGTAAIVLASIYLVGVYGVRRRGDFWPLRRTCVWVCGCVTMLFVTSSGLGRYMTAMFSVHMLVQVAMTMFVPILLVLGGPVTLALRARPPSVSGVNPGPRQWFLGVIHSPWARVLPSPVTVSLLFVAGGSVLYLAGAFDVAVADNVTRMLMTGYSLLSGSLFFWVVIGVDPSPRRVSTVVKVATAIGGLAAYVWVGIVLRDRQTTLGEAFYRSLRLDWHTDLLVDQRLGGEILSVGALIALLSVVAALFVLRRNHSPGGAPAIRPTALREVGGYFFSARSTASDKSW